MFSVGAEVDILPAVPVHALKPVHPTVSPTTEYFRGQDEVGGISRSASFTHTPVAQNSQPCGTIKRTFSDNFLGVSPSPKTGQSPHVPSKEVLRRASTHRKGKVAVTKFTLSAEDLGSAGGHEPRKPTAIGVIEKLKPSSGRSVSNTFRSLARRPWRSSSSRSRSPSPEVTRKLAKSQNDSPAGKRSLSIASKPVLPPNLVKSSSGSSHVGDCEPRTSSGIESVPAKGPPLSRKLSRRPLSAILHFSQSETEVVLAKRPSLSSLRSQGSADKSLKLPPPVKVPPIPSSFSSDRLSSTSLDSSKKKDPLWNVFRTLEADFLRYVR